MSWIAILGISLSTVAIVCYVAMLADWRDRRRRVKRTEDATESGAWRGWKDRVGRSLWPVLLTAGLVAGVHGAPLVERTTRFGTEVDAAPGAATAPPAEARESTVRLPFYVRSRVEQRPAGGDWVGASETRRLQLPWIFLIVAAGYGLARRRSSSHQDDQKPIFANSF